jgi:hypothetical protein
MSLKMRLSEMGRGRKSSQDEAFRAICHINIIRETMRSIIALSSHEYHPTSLSLHNAKRLDRLSISRRLVLLDGLDLGLLLVSRDRRLGNFLLFLVVGVYVLAWAVEVGLVEDWKGVMRGRTLGC